jgi:hypothetical protein
MMGCVSSETCWASYNYEIKILIYWSILLDFLCELYYDARIHENQAVTIFEVACFGYCCHYYQRQQLNSYAKPTDFLLTVDSSIATTYFKLHLLFFVVVCAVFCFFLFVCVLFLFYVFTCLCCMCVLLPSAWFVFVLLIQHVNKQLLNWVTDAAATANGVNRNLQKD